MPRSANFFVPLRVEGWGGRPPLDLDGWDQVVEFSLPVPVGKLALASGGIDEVTVGIAPGAYRARWSGRNLSAAATLGARRQRARRLPAAALARPGDGAAGRDQALGGTAPRGELGDLPALLADEELDAIGTLAGFERTGDGLRLARPPRRHRRPQLGPRDPRRRRRALDRLRAPRSTARRCTATTPACCPTPTTAAGSPSAASPEDPERLAHALRAAHAQAAGPHIALRGRRQHDLRRAAGAAALARLRPARQRPGHAAAPLRGGRVRARRRDEPDRHRPGPHRPLPARARRVLRGRRALYRLSSSRRRWNSSFWRFSPLAWTAA